MFGRKRRVCPVSLAGTLDNHLRRWVQDPRKILAPFLREGMTVLDLGCGPGFFTLDIARMVGPAGRVIASDLQEGMLEKIRAKVRATVLEPRITLHRCRQDRIGVSEQVDFVLAFYMVHEVPDQEAFFREIASILRPGGKVLVVEPPLHVAKKDFAATLAAARAAGFTTAPGPKVLLSKTAVLEIPGTEIPENSGGQFTD
ncbi:MAG: class I SAM-dependent methyltransferase [Desulfobulbaceae bacterium]